MERPYQQVAAMLRSVLLEQGVIESQQAWKQVQRAGYSKRTYMRARRLLQVVAKRKGWGKAGWWELSLPPAKIRSFPLHADLEQSAHAAPVEHAPAYAVPQYQSRIRA